MFTEGALVNVTLALDSNVAAIQASGCVNITGTLKLNYDSSLQKDTSSHSFVVISSGANCLSGEFDNVEVNNAAPVCKVSSYSSEQKANSGSLSVLVDANIDESKKCGSDSSSSSSSNVGIIVGCLVGGVVLLVVVIVVLGCLFRKKLPIRLWKEVRKPNSNCE